MLRLRAEHEGLQSLLRKNRDAGDASFPQNINDAGSNFATVGYEYFREHDKTPPEFGLHRIYQTVDMGGTRGSTSCLSVRVPAAADTHMCSCPISPGPR